LLPLVRLVVVLELLLLLSAGLVQPVRGAAVE
jgi:hypothetical protein